MAINKNKPYKSSSIIAFCIVQSIAIVVYALYCNWDFYVDDSYISLRYARNLLDGFGLIWNPGGEKVEGYTNFLYIILTAAVGSLGVDLVDASRFVSMACYVVMCFVFARFLKSYSYKQDKGDDLDCNRQRLVFYIPLALLVANLPLIAWSRGGLEVNLFAFLNMLSVFFVIRVLESKNDIKLYLFAGLLFALSTLARPEGGLFFAVAGVFVFVFCLKNYPLKKTMFNCSLMLLSYLSIFVPYLLWKYSYYGELLPNTYYVKTYGFDFWFLVEHGLYYLVTILLFPPFLIGVALFAFLSLLIKKRVSFKLFYLAVSVLLFLLHVVKSGGDYMVYSRFVAPINPILILIIFYFFLELANTSKWEMLKSCAVVLTAFHLMQAIYIAKVGEDATVLIGDFSNDYIKDNFPKGSVIAVNTAGAIPYYAHDYTYLDMLGLNDKHIARQEAMVDIAGTRKFIGHFKTDADYILSKKPDYIIYNSPSISSGAILPLISLYQLNKHPKLQQDYIHKHVKIPLTDEQVSKLFLSLKNDQDFKAIELYKKQKVISYDLNYYVRKDLLK